jgi:hypothetical protein
MDKQFPTFCIAMLQDLYWLQNDIFLERNDFLHFSWNPPSTVTTRILALYRAIVKTVRNYVMGDILKNVSTKPICVTTSL